MQGNRYFSDSGKFHFKPSDASMKQAAGRKIKYFSNPVTSTKKLSTKNLSSQKHENEIIHNLERKNRQLLDQIQKYKKSAVMLREKERQLNEQYHIHQKLIDSIPLPIYYKDISGKYRGCNKEFMEMFNLKDEDIIGKTINDFHFPNSEEAIKVKNSDKLLLCGIDKTVDKFNSIVKGEERLLINYKTILYDYDNNPVYITGTIVDATELEKTKEKLSETENRLELILNSMKETVIYLDNNMRIIWTNFNNHDNSMYGEKCHKALNCSNEPCKNCPSLKTRANGKTESAIVERSNKIFEVFSYPVINSSGLVSGTVEVSMDVTERENARKYAEIQKEQMINAEKMISLGIIVAETAHEINNPANFIKINSSIIKQIWECIKPILNDYFSQNKDYIIAGIPSMHIEKTMNDLINGVDDGTDRIRNIIENLKDYSRCKPLNMSGSFNINFAVQKSIALLNSLIKKSTDRFYTDYAMSLPEVKGDIRRIEQVIINLIQNACHSLPDKSRAITLQTFVEDGKVGICVKDEGVGIPPQNIDRVTDPFFTTKDKGVGLGLSISKNIIKDHNGDMRISSGNDGGTSVKILLPAIK